MVRIDKLIVIRFCFNSDEGSGTNDHVEAIRDGGMYIGKRQQ